VTADKVKDPARVDNFRIELDVPGEFSDLHKAGIENAVHQCLIHNTLLHPPKIAIEIREQAVAHS
jgi:putative redox protein